MREVSTLTKPQVSGDSNADLYMDKTDIKSIILRCGVSATTFLSLAMITRYYYYEWKIFKIDNSLGQLRLKSSAVSENTVAYIPMAQLATFL